MGESSPATGYVCNGLSPLCKQKTTVFCGKRPANHLRWPSRFSLVCCCEGSLPAGKPKRQIFIYVFDFSNPGFRAAKKPGVPGLFWGEYLFCRLLMERAKGIEPSYSAWEADVLPLNYARIVLLFYYIAFPKECQALFRNFFHNRFLLQKRAAPEWGDNVRKHFKRGSA